MSCLTVFYVLVWVYGDNHVEAPHAYKKLEDCAAEVVQMKNYIDMGYGTCLKIEARK